MNKVRTRFAPSPTGYMHIGNLRTALLPILLQSRTEETLFSVSRRIQTRSVMLTVLLRSSIKHLKTLVLIGTKALISADL